MADPQRLDAAALARWRADPTAFIEECLHDPETGKPFVLLPAEREFLALAFKTGDDGRLAYPELVFGAIKKSGKTTLAALIVLVMVLLLGGRYAEGYCVANDFEQAQGRVFAMIRRIVESSPLLRAEAKITSDRIAFPALEATIMAIASDAASAAGGNPTISCFDELWGYTSERSRRLWDEMITSPARRISARLTVSYAGFEGESELLQELYNRGMAQPLVGPDLHAGDGILLAWHPGPIAPWQSPEWIAEMRRSLRPNAFRRMICNEWVSTESTFIDMAWFDACVDPNARMLTSDPSLPIWVGVDASVKHDSTAIVATTWDRRARIGRLVWHRIYQPAPDAPLDFEATVETALLELKRRFKLMKVLYDPYQLVSSAQRLTRAKVPMEEFPQSIPNISEASQNLYELMRANNLSMYPDADIRLAVSRAIAVEGTRGWKIDKLKQRHKIDVVVAMGMSLLAASQGGANAPRSVYLSGYDGIGRSLSGDDSEELESWGRGNTPSTLGPNDFGDPVLQGEAIARWLAWAEARSKAEAAAALPDSRFVRSPARKAQGFAVDYQQVRARWAREDAARSSTDPGRGGWK